MQIDGSDLKETLGKLVNRYVTTAVLFVIWTGILDDCSLWNRYKLTREIEKLKKEKRVLKESIEQDKIKMEELRNDKNSLEKFAREEYYMKKDDEVIFIVK